MYKICTSIEQSKKLLELGINITTSDMYYYDKNVFSGAMSAFNGVLLVRGGEFPDNTTPAWSLTALMNLLPSEFTTENKFGKYKYEIDIRKYKFTDNVDIYQIAYGNYKWYEDGSHSWKDMINTGQKENLLDVTFDMVCWLLENKKL